MNDDTNLLQQYARHGSEAAFATLFSRHVDLVYSAALRQVRTPQLAEEVTQAVFIILARKAKSLSPKTILCGWLHRTARYVSANLLQAEFRRRRREREANMDSFEHDPASVSTWIHIAPLLDEALGRLGDKDRSALLLRYFENKSLRDVGVALGVEERAAQKRVSRSLEKLRILFARRGVVLTTAAIATAVSSSSVQAAPAHLTVVAVGANAAKCGGVSISTLTLVKGVLSYMAYKKATLIAVSVVAALLLGGSAMLVATKIRSGQGAMGAGQLREQLDAMRAFHPAIVTFARAHQNELPKSLAELKPYLPPELADMNDEHWEMVATGNMTQLMGRPGLDDIVLVHQRNVPAGRPRIIIYADGSIVRKK